MPYIPDVSEAVGAVSATWAGRKIIGPTLDKMGDQLKERYSTFSEKNLLQIVNRAERKLGSSVSDPGEIPPRVLIRVLDEGAWCESPIMAEYFGGILAASRSIDEGDDRGSSWAGFVSRLATFDVYMHYLIYDAFRDLYLGRSDLNLGLDTDRTTEKTGIYIPLHSMCAALEIETSLESWNSIVVPSFVALVREDLIDPRWSAGSVESLTETWHIDAPELGLVFCPSLHGIQLFDWAHANANGGTNSILKPEDSYSVDLDINHLSDCQRLGDMQGLRVARAAASADD
jgi:hypothetical protein